VPVALCGCRDGPNWLPVQCLLHCVGVVMGRTGCRYSACCQGRRAARRILLHARRFCSPNPLTITNIIQVSVLNQVSRRVSSYPTHVAHSILYTCLYQSQLRYIYMLFENRNCLYKKSAILLRAAFFMFLRKCKVGWKERDLNSFVSCAVRWAMDDVN